MSNLYECHIWMPLICHKYIVHIYIHIYILYIYTYIYIYIYISGTCGEYVGFPQFLGYVCDLLVGFPHRTISLSRCISMAWFDIHVIHIYIYILYIYYIYIIYTIWLWLTVRHGKSPFFSSVNHLFLWAITMASPVSHNQMVHTSSSFIPSRFDKCSIRQALGFHPCGPVAARVVWPVIDMQAKIS